MIECPICHVTNEDQAHFCSECGQRFTPAMQGGGAPAAGVSPPWPQANQPQSAPQQPVAPMNFGQPPSPADFSGQSSSGAFGATPADYAAQSAPPPGFGAPPPLPAGFPPAAPAASAPGLAPRDFTSPPDYGYAQVPNPSSFADQSSSSGFSEPAKTFSPDPTPPAAESDRHEPPKPARPRLHSPILGSGFEDEPEEPPIVTGKRNLRSPLLRGEDDPDAPQQNKSKSTGRLRSPLLRGEDDEDAPKPKGKSGGLRSPLLGGGDDDDVQAKPGAFPHRNRNTGPAPLIDDEPKQGAFPHRNRAAEPVQQDETGGKRPRLHSPILGGGGADDDYDEPSRGAVDPRPSVAGRRRLHSPVLDGTGEFDYDAWGQGDGPHYEDDDPNVLRSPLLAARQKLPVEKPAPPPIPQAAAPQLQPPAAQYQQPQQLSAPTQSPSAFSPTPDANFLQQMSTPPTYVPLTTPSTSMSAQTYAEPVVLAHESVETPPPPAAPAPSTVSKTEHAPVSKPRSAGSFEEKSSRVPLSIYDSGLRETIPGTIKSGPAMIIIIPALLALLGKGFYFFQMMSVPTIWQQTGFLADFGGQVVLILALLIFGMSANKKY